MFDRVALITLRGIFPNDFLRQRPVPLAQKQVQSIYTPMPIVFEGPEEWPKETNLKCWSCSLIFYSYPRFAPRNPRVVSGKFQCDVEGVMCRWSCSARHILDKFPLHEQPDALDLLCIIEAMFSGKPRKTRIRPSPDKTIRAEYCGLGGKTVDEYRELVAQAEADDMTGFRFDDWRPTH